MRKKSHAFSDAIGQKPTLIIYTPELFDEAAAFFAQNPTVYRCNERHSVL